MTSSQVMITRVPHSILRSRIDSGFYAPEHLERERRLRQLGVVRPAIGETASLVTDGTHKTPNYVENGVPFLSATNISDSALTFADHRFVSRAEFLQLRAWNCAPLPNDVVVAKSGSIGNAAVVPSHAPEFAVFESVAIVRCDRFDPYYLATFLNSRIGQQEIKRQTKGAVIRHLHLEDLREVEVPEFSKEAQCYIGDKVRQAERLSERARRLEAEFRSAATVAIPSSSLMAGKTSRVVTGELGRNLNPGAYTPNRRAVRAAIRGAGGRTLDTLADVESPTTDNYPATAPYLGLDAIDSATCGLKPSTAGAEAVAGTARLLREGPALSRLRPYLNKVTYIPPTLAGGIGSTELLLVRPKAGVDGWFLYGVLKLKSSVRQLNPVATGSTHPRVDREDVLDLLVPWRDEHEALGAKLRAAQACYLASAALTATATTLVEHIIDVRMTEAELVAAQKAIEAGDRSADREILKALVQGDIPDAKPVIPNVDALYALLDGPEGPDA
ncbi:hypothetical protein D7Y15_02885 [Corallococcus sp. AB030]|uniref:hypothetical protein n=1 Tax=Corallococcus sp. AB030 TaxID=2316716 RepID=UPI000EC5E941|nr:hypothetical protein [Corallococcus sp. AB030]RKI19835.1 hypothetical protein D7Y15_02885 [Corallococcus sp. AB030]